MLHLDRPTETAVGTIVEYKGTYSQYLTDAGRGRAAAHQAGRRAGQGDRPHAEVRRPVRRQGDEGGEGAQHREAHRTSRAAEKVDAPKATKQITVRFPDPPPCGQTVIEASGLCKGYGGPSVFEDVGFDLGRGERLLVLGLNGAGKTSLLRILAGETKADLGFFDFGYQVTAGYYAQEHDNLDGNASLLDNIRADVPSNVNLTETELRGLLGMFGLSGEKVFQEAASLSGGEKTKLALAMLMVGRNNLLLLDEPTNNLDPPSRAGRRRRAQELEGLDHLREPRHRVRDGAGARPRCCCCPTVTSTTSTTTGSNSSASPDRERGGSGTLVAMNIRPEIDRRAAGLHHGQGGGCRGSISSLRRGPVVGRPRRPRGAEGARVPPLLGREPVSHLTGESCRLGETTRCE